MTGNELYLVCQSCQQRDALRLGKRTAGIYVTGKKLDLDAWFRRHSSCGKVGPDSFGLALRHPMNHEDGGIMAPEAPQIAVQ